MRNELVLLVCTRTHPY